MQIRRFVTEAFRYTGPAGCGWYATEVAGVRSVEPNPILKATSLWFSAPFASVYMVHSRLSGLFWLSLGEFVLRRKRLVVLEFIRARRSRIGRLVDFATVFFVLRCSIRVQVLTEAEVHEYSERYNVPMSLFTAILWPLHDDRRPHAEIEAEHPLFVMSSGRAACDWKTLLEAERIGEMNWNLVVVCGRDDRKYVESLRRSSVEVLTDIPPEQHEALLRSSAIYVLCLFEENRSSGHIRLMTAIDCGVPVVAADVGGLVGYIDSGVSAITFAPGDAIALASAVDGLLASESKRAALARSAAMAASDRTFTNYLASISELVRCGDA